METRNLLRYFPLLAFLAISGNTPASSSSRNIGGFTGNPEFHPKRTKLKGWMKERKRSTFNKNR
jgi:hypothetical protein